MATNRKLGRTTDIRMSMLKNLTTDLLVYGKVETTLPRAKEVKSIADSLNLCAGGEAGYVVCDSSNVRGRARKGAAFQKADSK